MAVGFFEKGGSHLIYVNTELRKVSTVPRHREVKDFLSPNNLPELPD